MAWYTEFTDLTTGEAISALRSTSIRYRDDSGHEYDAPQEPAWCSNCQSIVNAEAFVNALTQNRASIETAIADPDSKEAWLFQTPENAKSALSKLNALAVFLAERVSLPRCLECYSTDLIELPGDEEFAMPNGHRYKRAGFGHTSMVTEPDVILTRDGMPRK